MKPITIDPFDEEFEYPNDDSGECCLECGFFHGHFRFCSQFVPDDDEI